MSRRVAQNLDWYVEIEMRRTLCPKNCVNNIARTQRAALLLLDAHCEDAAAALNREEVEGDDV